MFKGMMGGWKSWTGAFLYVASKVAPTIPIIAPYAAAMQVAGEFLFGVGVAHKIEKVGNNKKGGK